MYCLILFYLATEERLRPYSPFAKFMCIKVVLFFSFWQTCFLNMLVKFEMLENEEAEELKDLLTSVEMVFIAVA